MSSNKYDIKLLEEALDHLCYNHSRYPFLEMREWFDDDLLFAEFLEKFAGCYIIFPEMHELVQLSHKILAGDTVRNMVRAKERRDILRWGNEEGKLTKMSAKFNISKDKLKEIGLRTFNKKQEIASWMELNREWRKKNLKIFSARMAEKKKSKNSDNIPFISNARTELEEMKGDETSGKNKDSPNE